MDGWSPDYQVDDQPLRRYDVIANIEHSLNVIYVYESVNNHEHLTPIISHQNIYIHNILSVLFCSTSMLLYQVSKSSFCMRDLFHLICVLHHQ